jgi:hypothetical protein
MGEQFEPATWFSVIRKSSWLDPPVPSPPTFRRAVSNNAGFSLICWARAGSFCAMKSFSPSLREGLSLINRPIAGGLVAYKTFELKALDRTQGTRLLILTILGIVAHQRIQSVFYVLIRGQVRYQSFLFLKSKIR